MPKIRRAMTLGDPETGEHLAHAQPNKAVPVGRPPRPDSPRGRSGGDVRAVLSPGGSEQVVPLEAFREQLAQLIKSSSVLANLPRTMGDAVHVTIDGAAMGRTFSEHFRDVAQDVNVRRLEER